jgi:protein involved in polysaccharide export with SLBB domain
MLGSLTLQGRTAEEIAAEITEQLKHNEYVTNPFVSVQVTDLAPMYVYVRGAVAHPAAVALPIGQGMRVTQVLAAVGGLLEGNAVKEKVQLIHYNEDGISVQKTDVNLADLEREYNFDRDPALQNGDEVYVPHKLVPRVIVIGAVSVPQTVEIPEGRKITLSEAIAKCGGLDEKADSSEVQLQFAAATAQGMLQIDLGQVLSGARPDYELADGDRVYVPTVDGIVVQGRVKEPGVVYARTGVKMTVTRALSMAGGFISYASRNEVYVIKKGSLKPVKVDVGNILKTGDLTDDMELKPGDVVIVPEGIW